MCGKYNANNAKCKKATQTKKPNNKSTNNEPEIQKNNRITKLKINCNNQRTKM